MKISRDDSTSPGLLPVVHVTLVKVAALAGQSKPSIVIVYLVASEENPVPEKVTSVPPTTVPNLGLIELITDVKDPL